jgi:hypothetical protein
MAPTPLPPARPHSGLAEFFFPEASPVESPPAVGRGILPPSCGRRGCPSYAAPGGRYCGLACADLVREAGACELCGDRLKRSARQFCSMACRARVTSVEPATCRVCGRPTMARHVMLCSPACRHAYSARKSSPYAADFLRRVEDLIGQGLSRGKVAEALGVGKNVISGVCWRFHIGKPLPAAKPPKPIKPPAARKTRVRSKAQIAIRVQQAALCEASVIRVDTMPGEGCQFPISENPWRVCDAPRAPSSLEATRLSPYCARHAAVAYLRQQAA